LESELVATLETELKKLEEAAETIRGEVEEKVGTTEKEFEKYLSEADATFQGIATSVTQVIGGFTMAAMGASMLFEMFETGEFSVGQLAAAFALLGPGIMQAVSGVKAFTAAMITLIKV